MPRRTDFFALPPRASALEAALTPTVRGQIRSYFHDHPVLAGRALDECISGISKRIVRDLACGDSTARLAPLFVEVGDCDNGYGGVEISTATPGTSVEVATAEESPPWVAELRWDA